MRLRLLVLLILLLLALTGRATLAAPLFQEGEPCNPETDENCVPPPTGVPTMPPTPIPAVTSEPEPATLNTRAWALPQNLSESGAAGEPLLFHMAGALHLFWQDAVAGKLYSQGTVDEEGVRSWSPSVPVDLPFGDTTPVLVPSGDRVQAFWVAPEPPVTGGGGSSEVLQYVLWRSSAPVASITQANSWITPVRLAPAVLDVAVTRAVLSIEDDTPVEHLHLAFLGSVEANSPVGGLFYMNSADGGATWSEPTMLYRSGYLRPDVAENSHVAIAVDGEQVLISWDDRALEKVFVAHSADGGAAWDPVLEIDRRETTDSSEAIGPRNAVTAPYTRSDGSRQGLVVWAAGHGNSNCAAYFQASGDGGTTWRGRQPLAPDFTLCPTALRFVGTYDGSLLLLAVAEGQSYLLAWNGEEWSLPQEQPGLASFTHPDTFRAVTLGCHQTAFFGGVGEVVAVGCEAATTAVGDIWLTSRKLEQVAPWFEPPSAWSLPQPLAQVTAGADNRVDYILVGDSDGRFHVLWSDGAANLLYTRWDGLNWSSPVTVQTSSDGTVSRVAATVTADGRLVAFWLDGDEVFYSQVRTEEGIFANMWSVPASLPLVPGGVGGLAAVAGPAGEVLLAYSIPLNETRGIYLVRGDSNLTWAEEVQVFDGAAAGVEVVGWPQMALTELGVHLLWGEQDFATAGQPDDALYYARSDDGGESFTEAQQSVDEPLRGRRILAFGERLVYRFWQQGGQVSTQFMMETSQDDGQTWQAATPLGNVEGIIAVTLDASGQRHLVDVSSGGLREWLGTASTTGSASQWVQNASLSASEGMARVTQVSLAAAGERLGVMMVRPQSGGEVLELVFSGRDITLLDTPVTPSELPTATPTPSPQPTQTPPAPTPTRIIIHDTGAPPPGNVPTGMVGRLMNTAVPALLVVVVLVALAVMVDRGRRWLAAR